ncbi:hypothetical protein Tco_0396671 [Tanacetum coccineum]
MVAKGYAVLGIGQTHALALTKCYHAFLITAKVPVIYMHQFWATINRHTSSYRFKINNKRFSMNVEVFREIPNICPKIPSQEFDEPPSEKEALSFIRELGHTREIKYITDEGLAYQIDNKDKMFYLRFTKIIIHHFLRKDKSLSMRNRTFMHTARDENLLGSMRFVSRHEDTQVYDALLPKSILYFLRFRISPESSRRVPVLFKYRVICAVTGQFLHQVEFFKGWKPLSPLKLAVEEVMSE